MIDTETKLWQKLKRDFKCWPEIRLTRIETSTINGVPDVCYTDSKINGWIELKIIEHIDWSETFKAKHFNLSTAQIRWLRDTPHSFVLAAVRIKTRHGPYYVCLCYADISKFNHRYSWGQIINDVGVTWPYLVNFASKLRGGGENG